MQRRPLVSYAPPVLLAATCLGGSVLDGCRISGDVMPPPVGGLDLDPSELDFGEVVVGDKSVSAVQACNASEDDLEIASAILDDGWAFYVTGFVAQTLEPRECASFTVAFTPLEEGLMEDTVEIGTSAAEPTSLGLMGTGVTPP